MKVRHLHQDTRPWTGPVYHMKCLFTSELSPVPNYTACLRFTTHDTLQSTVSGIVNICHICHNLVMCQNGEIHRMLSGRHCWQKCDISDVFWQ